MFILLLCTKVLGHGARLTRGQVPLALGIGGTHMRRVVHIFSTSVYKGELLALLSSLGFFNTWLEDEYGCVP